MQTQGSLVYNIISDTMELQTPATAKCPMCESAEVTIKENANGKPYFTCRSETCNTTVNLNGGQSTRMLQDYLITDDSGDESDDDDGDSGSELDLEDEPADDDGQTLEDILGGDDGE